MHLLINDGPYFTNLFDMFFVFSICHFGNKLRYVMAYACVAWYGLRKRNRCVFALAASIISANMWGLVQIIVCTVLQNVAWYFRTQSVQPQARYK